MQTRKQSLIETAVSTAVRYATTIALQVLLLPLWGIHIRWSDNLSMGLAFTAAGLVISYVLRRAFNAWNNRGVPDDVWSAGA